MSKSQTILVVDDESDIVEILTYNLNKGGYSVINASSGQQALLQCAFHKPDLVIMDIRMPGLTGIETCRELKKNDRLQNIPVLFLTADADEFTSMNAMEAGGTDYITKPIHPKLILGIVEEILGKNS